MDASERTEVVAVQRQRLDVALGDWRFSLNNNTGKFEVCRADRPDLAHLTISWGTASRTLDVHLTYGHEQARVSGGEKDWRPLFQVPLAVLEARGAVGNDIAQQSLVPKLLENYKKLDAQNGQPVAITVPLKKALEGAKAAEAAASADLAVATNLVKQAADLTTSQKATQTAIAALQGDVLAAGPFLAMGDPVDPLPLAAQHFETNQAVTVDVTRTPLVNGRAGDKSTSQDLGTVNMYTVKPVFLDVGIGPAVTFERSHAYGIGPNKEIIESQSTATIDAFVNISAYYWWAPRYLDGKYTLTGWQCLPRPMVGASLTAPFSSAYVGLEWDPFPQFLDLVVGERLYSATELVGPPVGALANKDSSGNPVAPSTRTAAEWAPFVGISASTDLFSVWLKSIVKGP